MLHIVLVEPEIPQNTGNISRTCAVTGSVLHLVRPLGFAVTDKHLKRAGLDYWAHLDIRYHDRFEDVEKVLQGHRFFFLTTRAKRHYADIRYQDGDALVFGKETAGLPQALIDANGERAIRIPMRGGERSLNLSNSAAIVLYEALRQLDYPDML